MTDFGGDGDADVRGVVLPSGLVVFGLAYGPPGVRVGSARGSTVGAGAYVARAVVGGTSATMFNGESRLRSLAPVVFSDENIRNGTQTYGWLDITAVANHPGEKRLTVHRLIFDDASATAPTGVTSASTGIPEWQVSAVPEPGSNLALLALGAGGLTLRRRLKRAA